MRTCFIDPDLNKIKRPSDCCVCGRQVGFHARYVRLSTADWSHVIHPDDATDENSIQALVGADCAKKIPAEFLGPY